MRMIDWGMIISHHPPSQYNRTFRLFGIRFCTRCTGILFGTIVMFVVLKKEVVDSDVFFPFILLFSIPAILNFTLTELEKIKNNHFLRFTTGFLLGNAVGFIVYNLFWGTLLEAIITLVTILLLEILVAVILSKKGKLEPFIKQYEEGVYKEK